MQRLKKSRLGPVAAVALTATSVMGLVGIPSSASAASQSPWATVTLKYNFSHEVCQSYPADNGKAKLGARDDCTYNVLDAGKKIGYAGFICTLIDATEGICDGSFIFPGGTISTEGDQIDGKQIAISGGTGKYEGAVGEWNYSTASTAFTLHLLLPRT